MVNFNDDATIGMPAVDIERVTLLQRRYDFIEAFEDYKKKRLLKVKAPINVVRARLISLFLQMDGMLFRKMKGDFTKFKDACFSVDEEDTIMSLYMDMSRVLDNMNLTKLDNKKDYDRSLVEAENAEAGL